LSAPNDSAGCFASITAPLHSQFTRQSPTEVSVGSVSGQYGVTDIPVFGVPAGLLAAHCGPDSCPWGIRYGWL